MKPELVLATQSEIVEVLRRRPLVKLRESVKSAFVVGSFAEGAQNDESAVDALLEVAPHDGFEAPELEEHYRRRLREHFMRHNIRGKDDSVHPQWCGRRVEGRPKVLLEAPQPAARRRARP
jgi:predicted nucleotidyltransferase